ncbi:hypothetical protein FB451DRAFT_1405063 [Mycena latifolia]|nr:hypothetical protein FB451DRAFT_1405063 [Mycena latifolia]
MDGPSPPLDAGAGGMGMLEPLLSCRLIDDFSMAGFLRTLFQDHELAQLAAAWPTLIALTLSRAPVGHAPSAGALSAFSRCCPNLLELKVSVHTRDAGAQLRALELGQTRTHAMRIMVIDGEPVASLAHWTCSRFVVMFPQLELSARRTKTRLGRR